MKTSMISRGLALALAFSGLLLTAHAGDDDRYVALAGGDVFTITGGTLEGATVLIKNDEIEAVGYDLHLPKGTVVHDVKGMRVYPGLVALRASGLTGGGGKVEDSFDPFNSTMILALSAGITTARVGSTVVKMTRGDLEGTVMREGVGVSLSFPRGFENRGNIRDAFSKTRSYLKDYDVWVEKVLKDRETKEKEPSKAGVNSQYIDLLRRKESGYVNVDDAEGLLAIAKLAWNYRFDLVIEGGREGWTTASELGRAGVSVLVQPREAVDADETTARPTGSSIENAAILHRHGVNVGITTLSPGISLGGIAGRDLMALAMDAAFAIRGGLPQDAALEALTLGAARILRIDEKVGSIEPGKHADLIVTDGDIFDYRTYVQMAFVLGKLRYDKNEETYFSHIRPRQRPEPKIIE